MHQLRCTASTASSKSTSASGHVGGQTNNPPLPHWAKPKCVSKDNQSEKEVRTNNYAPFRGFKQSPNLTIEAWNSI
ncbi:MAG TPA: hypothetical protein VE130_09485 [Nitrososphaeraceae archaeon]|nr:hypothetical protein [Nitrososphaeraceae archaeon]